MKNQSKYEKIAVIIILLVVMIPTMVLLTVDVSPHKLMIKEDRIEVKSKSFKIEDMESVKLLDDINIESRSGVETFTYVRGTCKIKGEKEKARVYIYKNKSSYIRIQFKGGLLIYNDKNSDETKETYDKLVDAMNKE